MLLQLQREEILCWKSRLERQKQKNNRYCEQSNQVHEQGGLNLQDSMPDGQVDILENDKNTTQEDSLNKVGWKQPN